MRVVEGYDVDVLIVGAGPVGLTAALVLSRWDVSVRVVDAAPGPATTSRALGTHARSLEIYDQLGVLDDLAPFGTRVNAFVRHRGPSTARVDFDFGELATRFPYMFNVDQVITEQMLRGHAAAAGAMVEWDTRLESFEADNADDDDAVTAVLRVGAGDDAVDETVRARYLWGCDGGHSTVRRSLGLPLTGEAAHTWLIADAVVETDLARDGVHWLFPPGGALMLFPFPDPGKWRLLDTSGEGDPEQPAEIARRFGAKLTRALDRETVVAEPSWVSKFTIQQRAVPAMHVGRCFVSGDAAHVHSPASGQGMNTGIQDAYNLAWKLAMVVHGDADPTLLESYDAERVPIGRALLASTGEVMSTAMVDTAGTDTTATDSGFARQLIRNMSGLRIGYPDSALTVPDEPSAGPGSGPRPGQRLTQITAADGHAPGWIALRAVLRTPAWHLLRFRGGGEEGSGADDAALPSWLQPTTIERGRTSEAPSRKSEPNTVRDPDGRVHDTLAATAGDWILVRPDGYVSARGTGDPALRAALDRLADLRTGAGARA